jgi:AcrR family transcriptional regulator
MPSKKRSAAAAAVDAVQATRVARRERRRERSREEILDAARRVLLRQGIAGMTLDAVAKEVGVSKTALYYYFASKDALLFELVFGNLQTHARAVHDAVETTATGAEALEAMVRTSHDVFASRLDDFRLAYLHGQVAGQGAVHFNEAQFARIRPLNDLWFAGAEKRLTGDRRKRLRAASIEPRLLAFLAWVASIGLLTMKGMVESQDDPLIYTDAQLVDALSQVFAAAAKA